MRAIDIRELTLSFNGQNLFEDFNFSVPQSAWTVLLGASGIGKSTLLRTIAGLENEAKIQGEIRHQGKIAWLAQQDSLYPWLSVSDNVQLLQHLTRSKTAESVEKARYLLSAVKMDKHLHKPCYQLSGGQRQRVALARTLMQEADIVLMDEPFSALDMVTRLQLQDLAHQLLAEKTVLLITHDPQEALRLGEQIYVLRHQPAVLSAPIVPPGKAPRYPDQHLWTLQQQLIDQLTEAA
ncbi:ABC transporter ATP-binding protein [Caviibacterium pharyngocola]|uniref:ABC transporter ATP-binding protein n=1 Tax=Caviibacterium pharyngocola TaxID=28159 RepID=A0A2M8RSP0_9PAST|nr:ABC transporter ATP-binding protein [Caviibacterium pharyngocola]PJG81907.1 ABC transporter ATP-binding protein [Caviibacterium pharyngocola]